MKTLIFQVAVGEVKPFYHTCMKSVEQYAERVGADYKRLTEPVLKIAPLNSHRSTNALRLGYLPHYEKANAFNYLDEYDVIALIDADIYIRDITPNIFTDLQPGVAFAGVRECDMPLNRRLAGRVKQYSYKQYGNLDVMPQTPKGIPFYNTGVILLSNEIIPYLNEQTPEQFLRRKEFERFINGEGEWKWAADQTMLNYWIQETGMKAQNLNWKWNALFNGVEDNRLRDAYCIHFFLSIKLKNIPKIIEEHERIGWKK